MNNLLSNNVVDLTVENFQDVILNVSKEKVVLIDFWAEWCEPCKDLQPILEKIASENPETLVLAKVDCDRQQEVAGQFGIRNLPTVMVVKDGQPVDGFAGVQTEGEIRAMLEKYLPKPEDALMADAAVKIEQGDYASAFPLAKQAYELNETNIDAKYLYLDCLVETGAIAQAKTLLETITLVDQDARYQVIAGKIELAEQAAESPELKALQEKLEQHPDDLQVKVDLGVALHQAHRAEEGLALLFEVISQDINFADAKKMMLDMINALPDGEPLKSQYRRKVYSLLY